MFFTYSQNNSGGCWKQDAERGIAITTIIEAPDAEAADRRAEEIGLYFDGCSTGQDCECCGDRWSQAYGEGDTVPSLYGTPIDEADAIGHYGLEDCVVHWADGTFDYVESGGKNGAKS